MTVSALLGDPKPQYFDSNGDPLNGGTIDFYSAGTSTPLDTYTSSAGTLANANPVVLNTRGEPANQIYGTNGVSYKMVLKDSAGVVIYTQDAILPVDSTGANILPDLASTDLDDGTKGFNLVYYPLTQIESSAGITPTKYQYPMFNVLRYGALGDGSDQTTAIANAFLVMEQARTVLNMGGINRSLTSFIYFPYGVSGKYRTSSAIAVTRVIAMNADKGVYVYSTESSKHNFVNSTNCESALINNISFGQFDTAFNISSGNIAFSRYTFNNIEILGCNVGIDTLTFAASRSSNLTINGISSAGTEELVKAYCDVINITDIYANRTINAGALFTLDGHVTIRNASLTPGNVVTQTDVRWIDYYASEDARRLTVDNVRFGSEFGGCTPLVVQQATDKSSIVFNNCWMQNGSGAVHYDGAISSVVLHDYPGTITFRDCWIDNSTINEGVVQRHSTFTDTPHTEFRIVVDEQSWFAISTENNNLETALEDYLRKPGQDPGLYTGALFQTVNIGNSQVKDLDYTQTTGNYFIVAGNTHATNTWHQVWHIAKDTATGAVRTTSISSSASAGLTLDIAWPTDSKINLSLSGGTFTDDFDAVILRMGI